MLSERGHSNAAYYVIPSVQHPQKGGTVGTEETAASQRRGEIKGFNGLPRG